MALCIKNSYHSVREVFHLKHWKTVGVDICIRTNWIYKCLEVHYKKLTFAVMEAQQFLKLCLGGGDPGEPMYSFSLSEQPVCQESH